MPMPASASRTGRTVAARLPLKARATSCGARGDPAAERIDCTALTCSGSEPGQGMTFSGSTARSEEHTSELQSLMRNTYAVFCLKKKNKTKTKTKQVFYIQVQSILQATDICTLHSREN